LPCVVVVKIEHADEHIYDAQYGLFGAATALGCLAIAYGFDAAGHASIQEAIFRTSIYDNGAVECVRCGIAGSPDDFGKFLAQETKKWGTVVKFAGIRPE